MKHPYQNAFIKTPFDTYIQVSSATATDLSLIGSFARHVPCSPPIYSHQRGQRPVPTTPLRSCHDRHPIHRTARRPVFGRSQEVIDVEECRGVPLRDSEGHIVGAFPCLDSNNLGIMDAYRDSWKMVPALVKHGTFYFALLE